MVDTENVFDGFALLDDDEDFEIRYNNLRKLKRA